MSKSVIESWKDSCQLFGKEPRKLFVLATLNNLIKSMRSDSGIVAMIAMLFMCAMMVANMGLSSALWERVFSIFTIKSALAVKIYFGSKSGIAMFFGALFTFTIALTTMLRPSIERKDGTYLLWSLIRYVPFFIVAQELVLVLPFFAYLFIDMKNSVVSLPKALLGTARLVVYQLPVVAALVGGYAVLLTIGKYLARGLACCGLPAFLGGALIPLVWYVIVTALFFSACSIFYTKVKHTNREILFGKQ
jgi:hypothetical protein